MTASGSRQCVYLVSQRTCELKIYVQYLRISSEENEWQLRFNISYDSYVTYVISKGVKLQFKKILVVSNKKTGNIFEEKLCLMRKNRLQACVVFLTTDVLNFYRFISGITGIRWRIKK
jgi:hypothetical protein